MSRVNANSTLRVEDYPANYRRDLLPRLFQSLNLLFSQVVGALNGNVEFGLNIPSQDNDLSFNSATLPSFKWALSRTPKFFIAGQAFENGQPVALALTWSYDASKAVVSITSAQRITSSGASALVSGATYKVSVRTMA